MSYNNYNRGYAEPTMTSADYMTRTYRWMALGLLITFAAAFGTATTPLFYVVNSLYLLFTIAERPGAEYVRGCGKRGVLRLRPTQRHGAELLFPCL